MYYDENGRILEFVNESPLEPKAEDYVFLVYDKKIGPLPRIAELDHKMTSELLVALKTLSDYHNCPSQDSEIVSEAPYRRITNEKLKTRPSEPLPYEALTF